MVESIDTAFVQQYQADVIILGQQKNSRLEGTTIAPVRMQGEYLYWERVGSSDAIDLVTRHSDTPNIEVDHSRRRSTASPKVWATLLDTTDEVRMMADMKNPYNITATAAMNRAKDKVIIDALEGSSWAGKTGTTEVALPSAQKIATGSVGLTLAKLLTAREMLAEYIQDGNEVYFVGGYQQQTNLLSTTQVTNSDYNAIKALVSGAVDSFLGMKFIWTGLLTKSSTTRYCYAYTKGAIGFGVLSEKQARIDQRSDKNYAWQIWHKQDMGATRVEDECVVQVACTES